MIKLKLLIISMFLVLATSSMLPCVFQGNSWTMREEKWYIDQQGGASGDIRIFYSPDLGDKVREEVLVKKTMNLSYYTEIYESYIRTEYKIMGLNLTNLTVKIANLEKFGMPLEVDVEIQVWEFSVGRVVRTEKNETKTIWEVKYNVRRPSYGVRGINFTYQCYLPKGAILEDYKTSPEGYGIINVKRDGGLVEFKFRNIDENVKLYISYTFERQGLGGRSIIIGMVAGLAVAASVLFFILKRQGGPF